jgi:hypothetical protein
MCASGRSLTCGSVVYDAFAVAVICPVAVGVSHPAAALDPGVEAQFVEDIDVLELAPEFTEIGAGLVV